MKNEWKNYQKININDEEATCAHCKGSLSRLADFAYDGQRTNSPTYTNELCKCRKCGTPFIMHYDLIDADGHIMPQVFTEDVNNPNYNWQDILDEAQKKAISDHLAACEKCQELLNEETLTNAWFAKLIKDLRKKRG